MLDRTAFRLHLAFLAVIFIGITGLAFARPLPREMEIKAYQLYDMVYDCVKKGGSYDACRAQLTTALRRLRNDR